jgi:integrase
MAGTIRCAGCRKARKEYVCPHCGATKCYIKLYWQGKDYHYRHYDGGIGFGYLEAERFLNKLRSDIDDHKRGRKNFDPTRYLQSKITELRFCVQVDKWQKDNRARIDKKELAPGTVDLYDSYRRTHWNAEFIDHDNRPFSLRNKDVRDIRAKDLKKFKDLLPNTIALTYKRRILSTLRTFFRWMHREEIIDMVPPFPVITGASPKQRKAITKASQEISLELIPSQHKDIISFGFETGIREGELAAVMVEDINTETWVFTVCHNYSSGNILMETTKGKHEDDIPLSWTAIEIVKRNIRGKHPKAFLFVNPDTGRKYLPQNIYKIWKAIKSPVNFHEAARHSFATQLAKSGATPQQIMRLCRHRDIRTTLGYVHMDLTDLRDLVNNRGEVVSIEAKRKKTLGS